MAVTGYQGAYIAVLIGGNTFKWKFVERDEELISMLVELESDFWNHVQDCIPPPLLCWHSMTKPVSSWRKSPSKSRKPKIS